LYLRAPGTGESLVGALKPAPRAWWCSPWGLSRPLPFRLFLFFNSRGKRSVRKRASGHYLARGLSGCFGAAAATECRARLSRGYVSRRAALLTLNLGSLSFSRSQQTERVPSSSLLLSPAATYLVQKCTYDALDHF